MISATEARKKVKKKITESENQELSIAKTKIKSAIANKKSFCYLGFRISNSTTDALKTLGYEITPIPAMPNRGLEADTRIAW